MVARLPGRYPYLSSDNLTLSSVWSWAKRLVQVLEEVKNEIKLSISNSATVVIYKRSVASPALPTVTATYTFSDGTIAGLDNGWSKDIPGPGTGVVWRSSATASSDTATDTIDPSEWSTPAAYAEADVVGYLTKDFFQLFAYANGSIPSFTGAGGTFKVFSDGVDVTTSATFSAVQSGLTGTINAATGVYSVTALAGDIGQLVLTAVYNGVSITRNFTVSKVNAGFEIVSSLPVGDLFEGRVVFLTTDGKLYRYHSGAWTTLVPAVDISGQLADAQIAALAASKITGQLTDAQLAAIAAAKITGQIATTQISDNSISTPKLQAGSVTTNEIAANTITAGDIAAGAVTATILAAGAVTAGKIAAGAVQAGNIAALAIQAGDIAANAIVAGKIAANAVDVNAIQAGAITTAKLAAGAVTAFNIAAGTITSNKIAAGTIQASNIGANQITSTLIAAGAITATHLAATNIITSSAQIANGIITNAKIGNLEVDNAKIANLTIGTGKIANYAINDSTTYSLPNNIGVPPGGTGTIVAITRTKAEATSDIRLTATLIMLTSDDFVGDISVESTTTYYGIVGYSGFTPIYGYIPVVKVVYPITLRGPGGNYQIPITISKRITGYAAGSETWKLKYHNYGGSYVNDAWFLKDTEMTYEEIKK